MGLFIFLTDEESSQQKSNSHPIQNTEQKKLNSHVLYPNHNNNEETNGKELYPIHNNKETNKQHKLYAMMLQRNFFK